MLRANGKLKKQKVLLKLDLNHFSIWFQKMAIVLQEKFNLWLIKKFDTRGKSNVINFRKLIRIFEKYFDPKAWFQNNFNKQF